MNGSIPDDLSVSSDIVERFLSHVTKRDDGHWEWTAKRGRGGHGLFRLKTAYVSAHRMSWRIFRGKIPDGLLIRHLPPCHFGWCVNPEHLAPGTVKQNVADRMETWMSVPRKPSLAYLEDLLRQLVDDVGESQVHNVLRLFLERRNRDV
jgi:hypothetical protein